MRASPLLALFGLLALSKAHSWVEQITLISPNGTFLTSTAPGFPRGNVLRSSPSFSDTAMVNLLPPNGRPSGNTILPNDPMCRLSQSNPTQTPGSPRLRAPPSSLIALRYQENGHVTLPQSPPGKPANSGKVYVYGTTAPKSDDTFLSIHNVWNADGTGGDKRGRLLTVQNYDDGQCYQVNGGAISVARQKRFPHEKTQELGGDLWCQTDLRLPKEAESGKAFTLYWVWDWSTLGGGANPALPKGLTEIYTNCMDIDVTAEQAPGGEVKFVKQDLAHAAAQAVFDTLNATPASPAQQGTNTIGGSFAPEHESSSALPSPTSTPPSLPQQPAAQPSSPSASQPPAQAAPLKDGAQQPPPVSITTIYVTMVPTLVPVTLTAAPTDLALPQRSASPPGKRTLSNFDSAKFRRRH